MRPVSPDTLEELGRLLNEFPGGECFAWFDKGMSELVVTTSMYGLDPDQYEGEDVEWIEEPQDDSWLPDEARRKLPDWMEDERRRVEAICADVTGRYLRVPIGAEYGAPGILDAFASTLTDPSLRDEIRNAMRGRGAFRRVKDALHRRGKLELWHRYQEQRQLACAREWLREQGCEPDEPDPRPALRLVDEDEEG
jgi:hypothetical protein